MKTTIVLDDQLHDELERYATRHGTTVSALIESGMRQLIAGGKPHAAPGPVRLPVHGSGGLQPGVDLNDSASLWEMMDRGNVDR